MTIKDLIEKYDITEGTGVRKGNLLIRRDKAAIKDGIVPEIKAKKGEIIAYFAAERATKEAARAERAAKIDAIPGLSEIKAAIADLAAWNREFDASFDDVGGLGVRAMPKYDLNAMKAKYPQAAAYLRAEVYAHKVNYDLSKIGEKALEAVINGDWENAMKDMDAEIKAFADKHLWD